MPVLHLKAHTPPDGKQFHKDGYPGPGAYLTPDGNVVFVLPTQEYPYCMMIPENGIKQFISDNGPAGAIDAHRFLDQLIALKG